jgi:hypothetical protein
VQGAKRSWNFRQRKAGFEGKARLRAVRPASVHVSKCGEHRRGEKLQEGRVCLERERLRSFRERPWSTDVQLSVKSWAGKCMRGEANRRARRVRSGVARSVYREEQETLEERKLAEATQVAAVNNQNGSGVLR